MFKTRYSVWLQAKFCPDTLCLNVLWFRAAQEIQERWVPYQWMKISSRAQQSLIFMIQIAQGSSSLEISSGLSMHCRRKAWIKSKGRSFSFCLPSPDSDNGFCSFYLTQCLAVHNGYSNVCQFHFKLKDIQSYVNGLVAFILAFFLFVGKCKNLTDLLRRNAVKSEHVGETIFISVLILLVWMKTLYFGGGGAEVFFFFFTPTVKHKMTTLKYNQKLALWNIWGSHISVGQFGNTY